MRNPIWLKLDSGVVESLSPVGAESWCPGREPGVQPLANRTSPVGATPAVVSPLRGSNSLLGNDTPGSRPGHHDSALMGLKLDSGVVESLSPDGAESWCPGREPGVQPLANRTSSVG